MGDSPSAEKLEKTATVCTEKILDIVLESMFRHDAKRTEKALDHYSEMYDHEECDTLRKTILTFALTGVLEKILTCLKESMIWKRKLQFVTRK